MTRRQLYFNMFDSLEALAQSGERLVSAPLHGEVAAEALRKWAALRNLHVADALTHAALYVYLPNSGQIVAHL